MKIHKNICQLTVPNIVSDCHSERRVLCAARNLLLPAYQATAIAVATRFAIARGSRNFQPKDISWSYRKRGNVPRTQIKRKRKQKTLATNQNTGRTASNSGGPNSGP